MHKLTKRISKSRNCGKIRELRIVRARVRKRIRVRIKSMQQERVNEIIKILENSKGNKRAFEAQRLLRKGNRKPLQLQDENGHLSGNPEHVIPMLHKFYEGFFNQDGMVNILSFNGAPRKLDAEITKEEVEIAVQKLNNGRAAGEDMITGEYFKYGAPVLSEPIANMFNNMFEKHKPIEALLTFIIIPLNKPGKAQIAENTRPISLVNIVRKTLSNIALQRLQPYIHKLVSINQRAYQKDRSAVDIIWTYRWINATVQNTIKYMRL
jgi:hypothetical protein